MALRLGHLLQTPKFAYHYLLYSTSLPSITCMWVPALSHDPNPYQLDWYYEACVNLPKCIIHLFVGHIFFSTIIGEAASSNFQCTYFLLVIEVEWFKQWYFSKCVDLGQSVVLFLSLCNMRLMTSHRKFSFLIIKLHIFLVLKKFNYIIFCATILWQFRFDKLWAVNKKLWVRIKMTDNQSQYII